MSAPAEIVAAVRDVLRITFVEPVRHGRPRPREWPRGLPEVGVAVTVLFGLLALAIVFAVPLREGGELTYSPSSSDTVPVLTVPLLLTGVLFSFILAVTAALHASWWLRLSLLVLGAAVVFFFAIRAWYNPLLIGVSVVFYLALVLFTLVRARRAYAWWELVVVAGLLLAATVLPWLAPAGEVTWGVDLRATALDGALVSLQILILPAMLVAGSAPAQIVVTGAQATASRPVGRGLFWTGFGVAVAWLAVVTWLGVGSDDLTPSAIVGALVALLATTSLVGVLLWRADYRTPPGPARYPEVWGGWLYPLAVAMVVANVVTLPAIIVRSLATVVGLPEVAAAIDAGLNLFLDNNPGVLGRGLLGLVVLVLAVRFAGRSRMVEAVALGGFAVLVLLDALGLVPGLRFLHDRSAAAMGLLASVVALAAALVAAARRRFGRDRAVGVLTVVLLAVLYPHRDLISDPLTTVFASTGAVVLVFGLAWRVFTEAEITSGDSRRYPRSTRVLLFLANALLATTGVAFVALSRGLGTDADPTVWAELGDATLGDPLFLAGLVAGLWLVLRPIPRDFATGSRGRYPSTGSVPDGL